MLKFREAIGRSFAKSGIVLTLSAIIFILAGVKLAAAQTYEQADSDRKVVSRVDPEYPDALKKLYIGGVVRLEVVISPSGTVKTTKLLGGSPILGQSSMKALKMWKYAPAPAEQTITVKFEFDPHR